MVEEFWHFAIARENLRLTGKTDDPILQKYKFTNCYRACDRVSQYVINDVIAPSVIGDSDKMKKELLFKIVLFKIFNKIETWETLTKKLGHVPRWSAYDFDNYSTILSQFSPLFNNAYLHSPGNKEFFGYKNGYQNWLKVLEYVMEWSTWLLEADCMGELYKRLLRVPLVGTFTAYQWCIDLNYSELFDFSENDYTMAGPGALRGASKLFGSSSIDFATVIGAIHHLQLEQPDNFPKLCGKRPLQLIDIETLLCEFDKYCREAFPELGNKERIRIKQVYKPSSRSALTWRFPPKWNLNEA